jgi:hypothetical protein
VPGIGAGRGFGRSLVAAGADDPALLRDGELHSLDLGDRTVLRVYQVSMFDSCDAPAESAARIPESEPAAELGQIK